MKQILFLFLFITNFEIKAQVVLNLNFEKSSPKLGDFYISDIEILGHQDPNILGKIYAPNKKLQEAKFNGTIKTQILNYYKNFNKNQTLVPIIFKIKELKLSENLSQNGKISGNISYIFEAWAIKNHDSSRLCTSRNSASYTRSNSPNQHINIENQIRTALNGGLNYVNSYIEKYKNELESFAITSQVIIKPFYSKPSIDTVYYQQRKVNWSDFKGPVRDHSHYGAAIFTSFGFETTIYVKDRILTVELLPKVFTDKNMSWAKNEIKNEYGLKHEQLHFDIAYLNTLRFLAKVKTLKAETRDDLYSMIKYEYLEFFRTAHKLQERYDHETNHSLNTTQQKNWETKIAKEINSVNLREIISPI